MLEQVQFFLIHFIIVLVQGGCCWTLQKKSRNSIWALIKVSTFHSDPAMRRSIHCTCSMFTDARCLMPDTMILQMVSTAPEKAIKWPLHFKWEKLVTHAKHFKLLNRIHLIFMFFSIIFPPVNKKYIIFFVCCWLHWPGFTSCKLQYVFIWVWFAVINYPKNLMDTNVIFCSSSIVSHCIVNV